MDINREKPLVVAPKEPLPQRKQRQRSPRQKHERDLRNPLVRKLFLLGDHRGPPKELSIRHGVAQVLRRPQKRVDAARTLLGSLAALLGGDGAIDWDIIGGQIADERVNFGPRNEALTHVRARHEAYDDPGHENDEKGKGLNELE